MNTLTTVSLSLALFCCSACGFQLRGTDSEFASRARVFVDASPDSTIKEELSKVLSDRSFAVVDNRDLANVLLRIADEQQSRRIVSVQRNGRVSEYELAHSVNIQVTQSDLSLQPGSAQPELASAELPQTELKDSELAQTELVQEGSTQSVNNEAQVTNRVEVIREYTYDETGVLGKEDEADILRKEMRRELALQIVLRAVATMASSSAAR